MSNSGSRGALIWNGIERAEDGALFYGDIGGSPPPPPPPPPAGVATLRLFPIVDNAREFATSAGIREFPRQ